MTFSPGDHKHLKVQEFTLDFVPENFTNKDLHFKARSPPPPPPPPTLLLPSGRSMLAYTTEILNCKLLIGRFGLQRYPSIVATIGIHKNLSFIEGSPVTLSQGLTCTVRVQLGLSIYIRGVLTLGGWPLRGAPTVPQNSALSLPNES